jgi:hypothetical protein
MKYVLRRRYARALSLKMPKMTFNTEAERAVRTLELAMEFAESAPTMQEARDLLERLWKNEGRQVVTFYDSFEYMFDKLSDDNVAEGEDDDV